jgi:hypothetical protein
MHNCVDELRKLILTFSKPEPESAIVMRERWIGLLSVARGKVRGQSIAK